MPPLFDPRMALYDAWYGKGPGWTNFDGGYGIQQQPGFNMKPPVFQGPGARRKLNFVGMFMALAVPFALFMGTFYVLSFGMYYRSPGSAAMLIVTLFFMMLVLGAYNLQAKRTHMKTGHQSWLHFIFWTGVLACLLGVILGYMNMASYSQRYYDYMSLRKIVNVEPGVWKGQQVLDAGEIDFKSGTQINRSKHSLWYKSKAYCVAPIVPADGAPLASYDFWAVGMDCCSTRTDDWSCADPGVYGGLRVIDDAEIKGYRLAVEQASAKFKIHSDRPIFLYMMKQPYQKIVSYYSEAQNFAIVAGVIAFLAQAALVLMQASSFGFRNEAPSGYKWDNSLWRSELDRANRAPSDF